MNRTILIIIGILCTVITAVGIMWYNAPQKHLFVSTSIIRLSGDEDTSLSTTPNTFDPKSELQSKNLFIRPFLIPEESYNSYNTTELRELQIIEKHALDYINKIISPDEKLKSYGARADIELSSDSKVTKYTLYLYNDKPIGDEVGGIVYTLILKKINDSWAIINTLGRSSFRVVEWPPEK